MVSVARSNPEDTRTADPLDRLTKVAAALFDAPAAAVSLLAGTDVAIRSGQGDCGGRFTAPAEGFTASTVELGADGVLVVEDARADPRFVDHFLVTGEAQVQFYVGATITLADGQCVGALCVLDRKPRPAPTEGALEALRELARTAADILDREAQSRAQNEQLQVLGLAEAMSGVGRWRLDPVTSRVEWSDEVYRIHGVTRETFDPQLDNAIAFYHPDDVPRVHEHMARIVGEEGQDQFELRLIRADGEERIVQSCGTSERDETGAVRVIFGVFQDVTETHRMLARMRKNEARYRLLADNSDDVISRVRRDGTSRYISPSITTLLGWRFEDMSGQSMDYVHPDDRAGVLEVIAAVLDGSPRTAIQHRAVRRDGSIVWVESRFGVIDPAKGPGGEVVVAIRDISQRKALEDQLQAALEETRRNEQRYRLLAERSQDIIVTYGVDSIVTYASPALERLAGISPAEMVGTSVNRLVHPDDIHAVQAKLMKFIREQTDEELTTLSYRAFDKEGNLRFYETRTRVVRNEQGHCVEIQDVSRDVTETRRLEVELREALEKAEAAGEAKSEFLANMSHELRTPLTSIIGFADLLRRSPALARAERAHVERISTGSAALLSVINDILDYSKLEAGALEMDVRAFNPAALAQGGCDLMEAQHLDKGLGLELEIGEGLPSALMGDDGRLRQVVLNFLSNAVKFTPSGEVRLSVGGRPEGDRWRLRVEVSDTGIGVDPAKLASLFDRFTQADQSTSRHFGGTGLGLAISKRLIESMGGEIGAHSEPGHGATFWFEVPMAVADHVEAVEPVALSNPDAVARVLVVDDAPANRELIGLILRQMGLDIDTATNGLEAVEAVTQAAYDLVLMDVHMPLVDGLEATRRIREAGGRMARTPILALTANVQAEHVQRCLEAGMNGHLGKPIDMVELAAAIGRWAGADGGVDAGGVSDGEAAA